MKTTFDLPDLLLRRAKAAAADQGRPLRDLVAEALTDKLSAIASARKSKAGRKSEWEAFEANLKRKPDGSFFNPQGIDDPEFFEALETIRTESRGWRPRNPFAEIDGDDAGDTVGVAKS